MLETGLKQIDTQIPVKCIMHSWSIHKCEDYQLRLCTVCGEAEYMCKYHWIRISYDEYLKILESRTTNAYTQVESGIRAYGCSRYE